MTEAMAYFVKDKYDKVRGMSVWSLQLPKQLRKAAELIVTERKHIIRERTCGRNDNFVWLVVGAPDNTGAITVTPLCSSCKHLPKDDFILRVTENHWEQQKGSKEMISGWRVRRLWRAVRLEQLR